MILEQLIQDYLTVSSKRDKDLGSEKSLSEQDKITEQSKYMYEQELRLYICDLIRDENNKIVLKYLIDVYMSRLASASQIPERLYKRYLALNITDQHMCKEFVDFMNNNWSEAGLENGRHLYKAILDEDYTTAKEFLEKV